MTTLFMSSTTGRICQGKADFTAAVLFYNHAKIVDSAIPMTVYSSISIGKDHASNGHYMDCDYKDCESTVLVVNISL